MKLILAWVKTSICKSCKYVILLTIIIEVPFGDILYNFSQQQES